MVGAPIALALLLAGGCGRIHGAGQLGDGTTAERHLPIAAPAFSPAVSLDFGLGYVCALHPGGTVTCRGANGSSQLGDGPDMDGDVDGLADAISIGIGQASGYAIRSSGGAVAWGHNSNGQLGDGTTMDRAAAVPILIPP